MLHIRRLIVKLKRSCVVNVQKLLNRKFGSPTLFQKTSAKLFDTNQREMNVRDNISARFKDLFFSTI